MRPRVLIIESDAHFARELTQCFHRAGAECQTAADGEEGLRLAHAQRPALIVLAVELPTGSGYLVCKRLKRHAELKQTPLILISSDPHADDNFAQHQKLRSRADLYLKKPLSCVEVVQAATEWLPVEVSEALELDAELEVDAAEGNAPMFDDELLQQLGDDLDAEIEAFADSAFDSLVADDDEAVSRSGVPAPKHSVPAVMPSAADVDDDLLQSMVQTAHDTEPPTTEPRRSSGTPGPLSLLPYSDALEGRGGAVSRDAWSQVTAPPPEAHASAASRSEAPGALPVVAAAPRSTSAPRDSWGQPRRSRRPSGPQSLSAAPGGAGQAGASTPPRRSSHPSAAAAALAGERQRLDERARHSEINRLRQEVDQLRAHADSQARAQGADPDALFALREQLSVKDNEIFALRDRLSEKDHEILELRDSKLRFERGEAELRHKLLHLEREHQTLGEQLTEQRAAHQALSQQQHGLQTRLQAAESEREQTAAKLLRSEESLARTRREHSEAIVQLKHEHEAALQSMRQEQAQALAARERQSEDALEAAAKAHQAERSALSRQHHAELEDIQREHREATARALAEHASELAQRLEQAEQGKRIALESQQSELEHQHARQMADTQRAHQEALRVSEHKAQQVLEQTRRCMSEEAEQARRVLVETHAQQRGELEAQWRDTQHRLQEKEGALEELREQSDDLRSEVQTLVQERDALMAKLEEAQERYTAVRHEGDSLRQQLQGTEQRRDALEQRLNQTLKKIDDDHQLLERARRAMAIGLGLLEDQRNNPVDLS